MIQEKRNEKEKGKDIQTTKTRKKKKYTLRLAKRSTLS